MSTVSRFPGGANHDNTSRVLTNEVKTPAYAATLAIAPTKANTLIVPAVLTGALTITAGVGSGNPDDVPPFAGDTMEFLFAADATNRVVTFSTGFASAGTLTLTASKKGSATFTFDGTTWVETGRAITA